MLLQPILGALGARDWEPATCRIVESRVVERPSDDGPTWSAVVRYRYVAGGAERTGDRVDFGVFTLLRRDEAEAVTRAHPVGAELSCWVDPADPAEVVLRRELDPAHLRWLVFPLPFLAVGFGGVAWVLRPVRVREAAAPAAPVVPAGGSTLRPSGRPWRAVVVLTVAGLAWEAVALPTWLLSSGGIEGALLAVFNLVGLAILLGFAPYAALKATNPRAELVLSPPDLAPGERFDLAWRLEGRAGRVRRLVITLVGAESVTWRSGDSTRTTTEPFHEQVLADVSGPAVAAGVASGRVPERTMHSFAAPNNRIVWTIRVAGAIDRWPDIDDAYEITVHPRRRP